MRGNIDTRIKKLEESKLDGIILAAAGVKSLNLSNKIGFSFTTEEVIPSAGQGIIAVQCNKNDNTIKNFLKNINDQETEICARSERAMLEAIGGDCETAVGGLAVVENNNLKLIAQLFSDSGLKSYEHAMTGKISEAVKIGKLVGQELLKLAGSEFKKK
jgi:hydroxymethylbilane synthase